jgi:hypothetical protein
LAFLCYSRQTLHFCIFHQPDGPLATAPLVARREAQTGHVCRREEFWPGGSKRPAILRLLEGTLTARRHLFCPLILAVVQHSMPWRAGKGEPLTVTEIDHLSALLLRLEFKIPELHDSVFGVTRRFVQNRTPRKASVRTGGEHTPFHRVVAFERGFERGF